jgi:hypothetical protein
MNWYFSYSQQAIKILNQFNFFKASYPPHSVDHRQFYFIPKQPKSIDLCFVGKHSVHRERLILAALELTKRVCVYGS